MSRFEAVKEKVSDLAEEVKLRTDAAGERAKADVHEFKADQAEKKADKLDKDPDREDKLKPTAA